MDCGTLEVINVVPELVAKSKSVAIMWRDGWRWGCVQGRGAVRGELPGKGVKPVMAKGLAAVAVSGVV
jgi:hypothetical protein